MTEPDDAFVAHVPEAVAALPGVLAVALGGSRARGTARPDSDWDFALYYRSRFDVDDVRGLGWPGEEGNDRPGRASLAAGRRRPGAARRDHRTG